MDVSRPSDALTAKQATSQAFANLLLGVGAVALLVGGVGVANTMVISVLERGGNERCYSAADNAGELEAERRPV